MEAMLSSWPKTQLSGDMEPLSLKRRMARWRRRRRIPDVGPEGIDVAVVYGDTVGHEEGEQTDGTRQEGDDPHRVKRH